jgi:hypothetical protein
MSKGEKKKAKKNKKTKNVCFVVASIGETSISLSIFHNNAIIITIIIITITITITTIIINNCVIISITPSTATTNSINRRTTASKI